MSLNRFDKSGGKENSGQKIQSRVEITANILTIPRGAIDRETGRDRLEMGTRRSDGGEIDGAILSELNGVE
jgi:hypothetical protein